MSTIAVIGSGYVGLTTAACFAYHGHNVVGVDIIPERVEGLNKGEIPIYEEGLADLVRDGLRKDTLTFTTDAHIAVSASEFIFLCLPTPQDEDGSADLSYVMTAARDIAPHLQPHSVVINKSTVPIGSVRAVASVLAEHGAPEDVAIVSNPEFLREGIAVHDALNPGRIVIGCDNADASVRVSELYRLFNSSTVLTDPESAEMIKYASNAFLACKISFINEMSRVADAFGADIKEVAKGMGFDQRIGSQFLEPGPGYGGSCFPKDTSALLYSAGQKDVDVPVIRATIASNEQQFSHVLDMITRSAHDAGVELSEAIVGVWGLAFKANTDDVRDSPAMEVVRRMLAHGVTVVAYDPQANENAQRVIPELTVVDTMYDVLEGAHMVVVLTEWKEFIDVDFSRMKSAMKTPTILDMRNILDVNKAHQSGFTLKGLGRNQ